MANSLNKLTELAVRKAAPMAKPYKLADGGGLYLEVMPNGSKYWRMKYRFLKREDRLALGVYPRRSTGVRAGYSQDDQGGAGKAYRDH
ncbi:MAG: DUF4102 domain-containing protein [Cellvibrionales bacterium]|nr:DUF4102 domain-containing protein [Cellvibrionales bacterium]